MQFDLPLYMSDETRCLSLARLQMLDCRRVPEDVQTPDDDDGYVPHYLHIPADDDGCVPDDVDIQVDLALAQGLVEVQDEADATSQATTTNQLTQLTVLGGGVHITCLESEPLYPEQLDDTPI
jgi:hypothetical protein